MKTKTGYLISLVASSSIVFAACTAKDTRPNILFCIADDAGLHMGAYGVKWTNTPNFDSVAKQGLLFTNTFAGNSKSAPSRATMITGRNSWQLEDACNHWSYFPAKFKSFPEALQDNGYEVGYTGKGWGPGVAKDKSGHPRNLTGKEWGRKTKIPPAKGICNIDYAGNFAEFMKNRDKSKPFCFWYGAHEPHNGYEVNSFVKFGKKTSDIDKVPSYWPDNEIVRGEILDYSIEVEHFDNHLGQMLDLLEKSGELDNTIVIVTSDQNVCFPRCKGHAYYDSNHIPMAIMWRNGIKRPGRKVDEYISSIDFAPTILEAAKISEKESGMQPVTGRSFMDILKGKNTNIDRNYVLMGRERHDAGRPYDQGYPVRCLLKEDYLYIRNFEIDRWPAGNPELGYIDGGRGAIKKEVIKCRKDPDRKYFWDLSFGKRPCEELYNIKKDSECMHNLAGNPEYGDLMNQMKKEMFHKLVDQEDPRAFGYGYIFDDYQFPIQYPYRNYWEKIEKGEKVIQDYFTSDRDTIETTETLKVR